MSRLPFRQTFKKRGNVAGDIGDSTFETDEEKPKIPNIDKVMDKIDRHLKKGIDQS
jgi:hypothetical protein